MATFSTSAATFDAQSRYVAWFEELDAITKVFASRVSAAVYSAWRRFALRTDPPDAFVREVRVPEVRAAVLEIDDLLGGLFEEYFGDARTTATKRNYLETMFRFATDTLANDGEAHALGGDFMWFASACQVEAAHVARYGAFVPRHAVLMAGLASGCAAHFACRGDRRTRPEYRPGEAMHEMLHERGLRWASSFDSASAEVHALYRIREFGHE